MAINTFNIPNFEYYSGEANYVSPAEVSEESIEKIKSRNIKLGKAAIFGGNL